VRILIVEDKVKMAGQLWRALRGEGMAADVAINGEDALWIAESMRCHRGDGSHRSDVALELRSRGHGAGELDHERRRPGQAMILPCCCATAVAR
jgi:hypothetical protein